MKGCAKNLFPLFLALIVMFSIGTLTYPLAETLSKVNLTTKEAEKAIETKLARFFGVTPTEANANQVYKATVLTVRDILTQKRSEFKEKAKEKRARRVYYLCMEFLVGRGLKNNLMNLGIADVYAAALKKMGYSFEALCEMEPDPGLGNGGLGRLAACFMDSLTTMSCFPLIPCSLNRH